MRMNLGLFKISIRLIFYSPALVRGPILRHRKSLKTSNL